MARAKGAKESVRDSERKSTTLSSNSTSIICFDSLSKFSGVSLFRIPFTVLNLSVSSSVLTLSCHLFSDLCRAGAGGPWRIGGAGIPEPGPKFRASRPLLVVCFKIGNNDNSTLLV